MPCRRRTLFANTCNERWDILTVIQETPCHRSICCLMPSKDKYFINNKKRETTQSIKAWWLIILKHEYKKHQMWVSEHNPCLPMEKKMQCFISSCSWGDGLWFTAINNNLLVYARSCVSKFKSFPGLDVSTSNKRTRRW
jgi:hypothetical protein